MRKGGDIISKRPDWLDPNISDGEFARRFVRAADEVASLVRDDDFEVVPEQMEKLKELVEIFRALVKENHGKIEDISIKATEIPNGVTAAFDVLYLGSRTIPEFCRALQMCSAATIDATLDGVVHVSCTIPDVYRLKMR